MKTIATTLCLLLAVVVSVAETPKPELPKTPRGFDEGRKEALKDAAEDSSAGDQLIKSIWEDADAAELAEFIHDHFNAAERGQLDKLLELEGALTSNPSTDDILKLFNSRKLKGRAIVKAIAKMHRQNDYTLLDSMSWLYLRDYNFQVINAAFNGERIDAIRLRAEFRELIVKGKEPHRLFEPGLWEFSLKDGREEQGGHYDGAQLVEVLLELGWDAEMFAKAMDKDSVNDLSKAQRDLIAWKDPWLLWAAIETTIPESELFSFAKNYYKKQDRAGTGNQQIAKLAIRRFQTVDRWFRTGGEGVVAVYQGPWPDAKGAPKPPKVSALEIGENFAEALGDPLWNHFRKKGDQLTIVLYADGSARAMLNQPKRTAH
ncbi:MAG: hypothetical protein V3V10_05985, partial [Planctomycetota bacterium]